MKYLTTLLALALVMAGCSPKSSSPQSGEPLVLAADLGQDDDHYKSIYGAPKSESRVATCDFVFPGYTTMLRLARPLIIQQYQQGNLSATVVCAADSRRAIFVRYQSGQWTDEQLKAALAAYDSGWKQVQQTSLNVVMPSLAPKIWLSPNGTLAYKDIANQLFLYAPQLHADLRNQIAEIERQKKAVPKF